VPVIDLLINESIQSTLRFSSVRFDPVRFDPVSRLNEGEVQGHINTNNLHELANLTFLTFTLCKREAAIQVIS